LSWTNCLLVLQPLAAQHTARRVFPLVLRNFCRASEPEDGARRACHSRRLEHILPIMLYHGVEYSVRARPGRNEWIWTFYPENAASRIGNFTGPRYEAVARVKRKIDDWLQIMSTQVDGELRAPQPPLR